MIAADFDYVRKFLQEEAAIVLEPGKEYLVQARLEGLAKSERFDSVGEFIGKLRADPTHTLHRRVLDVMTTNETLFFRDLHPFEALKQRIIPELIARRAADRHITIWCGASSTGQEPFSVMMLIAEQFPQLLDWKITFLATDLCTDVLVRARKGRFSQLEINRGLPAAMLVKYFVREGAEWEFSPELRRRINFSELNLVKPWPELPPLDLVFLRNVLIYFDVDSKRAIFRKIRRLLRPGGHLLLGAAETTYNLDDGFERVAGEKASFFRLKD